MPITNYCLKCLSESLYSEMFIAVSIIKNIILQFLLFINVFNLNDEKKNNNTTKFPSYHTTNTIVGHYIANQQLFNSDLIKRN